MNDYLRSFQLVDPTDIGIYRVRRDHCSKYAFAIPSPEALEVIADRGSRIVEIGAGTGFWANELSKLGVDIVAYDVAEGENNYSQRVGEYFSVKCGNHVVLEQHPDRDLLLVWPPYESSMAYDCLRTFRGETFFYIGEDRHGCTGDDQFFDLLEEGWTLEQDVAIPRWRGIYDQLSIYRRKG